MQSPYNAHNIDIKSERVARVALKTFFNIMREWHVSEAQQVILLGTPSFEVYKNWRCGIVSPIDDDTLTRISTIITIYKNLGLLFSLRKQANDWVHKPNDAFKGASALDVISSGHLSQMHQIIKYLNNQLH